MTGLAAIIAAATSWAVLGVLIRRAGLLPLDVPNARSPGTRTHTAGGGLAIWWAGSPERFGCPAPSQWLGPLLAVMAVSLLDDLRGVPQRSANRAAWRLPLPGCVACRPGAQPGSCVLAVVWMANLYNFMDGSDGLAGAMAVIGFGAYAAAAWLAGSVAVAPLLALATAAVPFLLRNAPPARVLLGDVGAVPLGFLAAIFGITGWQERWWPAWFPVLVFLPFIADATATLVYRLLRGARIWQAHREHYYQRLVQIGWGHGRTLALYGALMVATAGSSHRTGVGAAPASCCSLSGRGLALVFAPIDYWHR